MQPALQLLKQRRRYVIKTTAIVNGTRARTDGRNCDEIHRDVAIIVQAFGRKRFGLEVRQIDI